MKPHIKNQRYKQALEQLEPYKSLSSRYIQKEFARIYRHMKQWDKCYEHASLAVAHAPYSYAQGLLGFCAHKLEKWEDAKQAFINNARYSGVGAWNLYYLANAFLNTGDYATAYPLFKESIILKADYRKYSLSRINYIEEHHPKQTTRKLHSVYQQLGIGD